MKLNPCERQEASAKSKSPFVLLNILSTLTMYSGNKRGLDAQVNTVHDMKHSYTMFICGNYNESREFGFTFLSTVIYRVHFF